MTAVLLCAVLALAGARPAARGAEYRDDCESSRTSWEIHNPDPQVQLLDHRRNFLIAHTGQASEQFRLSTTLDETSIRLVHPVDAARILDELKASVWVLADRPGAVLAMHVRLPHQIDPQTGKPLEFEIHGEAYTLTDRWEEISVGSTQAAVDKQLMLWRRRLAGTREGQSLDERNMYVYRLSLVVPLNRGHIELLVDDLTFGPLVQPSAAASSPRDLGLQQERQESPIQLGPHRIAVNGKPFFPRFTPHQGENLDVLKDVGINVALIENYDERILIDELSRRGIWVMAPPPQSAFNLDAEEDEAADAGLMPIPASTSRVLFWMLGTRIPSNELRKVERWAEQLHAADRAFLRPRPIIADVISQERAFSRHVSMLGNSRHSLHTTFTPLEHRDYLRYKKLLSLPDRFAFTWVQTQAAPPNVATRHPSRDRPIIVEAEQIWMQAWEAISVGHRGLGYWKSGPLDLDTPDQPEQRLALSLLNAQIELLEPLLATGKVVDTIPVSISAHNQSQGPSPAPNLIPSLRRGHGPVQAIHPEIQAAVIESDYGRLVIPVWYESGAQFQPGEMAAAGVSFVVRGVEHARAWEVTTTGVQPLDLEQPVPGGMEFHLPRIDQFAFVVITNDLELEARLSQKMRTVQQRCAGLWVELARARLNRVRPTHELLQRIALARVRDGDSRLRSAAQRIDEAEVELQAERYDEARYRSRSALQILRGLQRAHWENAVAGQTSPVSSPHTLCFETLPDHWRMIAALGRSVGTSNQNLLRSGDFEDYDTVRADKWQAWYDPEKDRGVELHADAFQGRYSLRMVSRSLKADVPAAVSTDPNVTVVSPPVPIQGGQVVIVSGQLRVQDTLSGHPDGLMIYDNIKGTVGSLRWHAATPKGQWQQFRLVREAAGSIDFRLHLELNGDGDVRLDDIRIETLSPLQTAGGLGAAPDQPRHGRLDWTPSLPKVPFWNSRKSDSAPE
ncbi:MAG: hypothetical protein AB7U20_23110 [Planctomycetaceae bacterium]